MQLHQLARVVLVESGALAAIRPEHQREIAPGAEPVVEIEEHRGMRGGSPQQVTEPSEHMGPDDVALVGRDVPLHFALGGVNVEMIEPEVDHYLFELPLTLDRAHQACGLKL